MTAQSDIGRLVRVAMKHPRDAFVSQAAIDEQWRALNFSDAPDFRRACVEFDALLRLLQDNGTTVELLPADSRTTLDSIYVRDASLATDAGIVLCSMGKALRDRRAGGARGRARATRPFCCSVRLTHQARSKAGT